MSGSVPNFDKATVFWGVMMRRVTLSLYEGEKCQYGVQFAVRDQPDGPGDWREQFSAYSHNAELTMDQVRAILPAHDQIIWDTPPLAHHSLGQLQLRGRNPLYVAAVEWNSPTGMKPPTDEQLIEYGEHLAAVRDFVWGTT